MVILNETFIKKFCLFVIFLNLVSENKGSMIHGEIPRSTHWSVLLHMECMYSQAQSLHHHQHQHAPCCPATLSPTPEHDRQLHITLSWTLQTAHDGSWYPGWLERVGGWVEMENMIYLLSFYSESVNHSSRTCPVFHLLLCLPQRPNSLGTE